MTSGLLGIAFWMSCTPAARAPGLPPEAPPSVSRVVPQASGEPASYRFTDASGRSFDGALVAHVAAPGRVALQRAESLDIIDTVSGARVATLPVVGQVVSVLPVQNGWRILSRTGARGSQPGLVLASSSGDTGSATHTLALELPPTPFSLLDTAAWHTDPFLSVDASGAVSVNVVQRCVSCSDTDQLALWRSSIDPQSGRRERWVEALLDREHSPDLVLPLFGPHVEQPPPPEVERVLQRMPTTADPGLVLSVAPDATSSPTRPTSPDAQGRANDIEVWNHASAVPQWSLQSCPAAPHFAGGAYVVCPKASFDDEGALRLDTSSPFMARRPRPPISVSSVLTPARSGATRSSACVSPRRCRVS